MNREDLTKSITLHWDTMYRIALGYVKNTHDAEDIAQNVFMKLYNRGKPFPGGNDEKAWLIRVTINESKNLIGSAWRRKTRALNEADESLTAPVKDEYEIYSYVDSLKPKYRTVIYLHYYEGYSTKEISSMLKIPQSTVTTQLNRARKQLKQQIIKEIDTNELQGFI